VVKSAGKSPLKVSITPASATFGGTIDRAFSVPDIARLTAPVSKLRELGESCSADLDAFSRWVGKNPERQKTAAALAMLPAELVGAHEDSEAKELWVWLESTLAPYDRMVCAADELLRHCPSFGAGKLAKSEAVILAQLLEKRGYGLEPDVRFGGVPLTPEGIAVLFKLPKGATGIASPNYAAATVLMHLAVAVASADGTISESEELRLQTHMTDALGLQAGEASRLGAHMAWLQQARPGFTGLKKRLEPLDDRQRSAIAEFAISVAGADGHVSPEEIKTLGKIYPLLGLPANTVYSHVHAMTTGAPETVGQDEPTVIAPREARSTYTIPQRPSAIEPVRLNMETVSAKLAESAKISAILDGIFSEDDSAPASLPPIDPLPAAGKLRGGHGALLSRLVERQQWSRSEFEELTQTLGLMPDGAVDAINEAAYEHVAGPVLEGDDPIDVDITAAKELLG
jgi:tellurite resistance protein